MGALYRYLDPREIDAIALSHLHADHCLDLCGYLVAARYSPTAPWPRRPVYAPANAAARLARAYDAASNDGEVGESGASIAEHLDWRTWQPSQRIGPFTVRTVRVAPSGGGIRHPGGRGRNRRRHHGVLAATPAHPRPGPARKQCRLVACGIVFSSTTRTILRRCISPAHKQPRSGRLPVSVPWCLPIFHRGTNRNVSWPRQHRTLTGLFHSRCPEPSGTSPVVDRVSHMARASMLRTHRVRW